MIKSILSTLALAVFATSTGISWGEPAGPGAADAQHASSLLVRDGEKIAFLGDSITPIREEPDFKLNATARDYNAFLRDLAAERSLPLADLHEAMFSEIAKGSTPFLPVSEQLFSPSCAQP